MTDRMDYSDCPAEVTEGKYKCLCGADLILARKDKDRLTFICVVEGCVYYKKDVLVKRNNE